MTLARSATTTGPTYGRIPKLVHIAMGFCPVGVALTAGNRGAEQRDEPATGPALLSHRGLSQAVAWTRWGAS